MKELLRFTPVIKKTVWGGRRLAQEFHYCADSDGIGECWGISAHPHGDCVVAQGRFQGMKLSQLYREHRELFGNLQSPDFPLLVKIIDAEKKLSIQVHPHDEYARLHENGSQGKTECWYVMDCPEKAELIIGHHARTREQLEMMIREGRYEELIRRVSVHKGDFIRINPGTIHSITEAMLILEIQQNSDITYRVYDYERLVNGQPRALHVEQSIAVTNVPDQSDKENIMQAGALSKNMIHQLIDCAYFRVYKLEINRKYLMKMKAPFIQISVLSGMGTIDGKKLEKGDHIILPNGYDEAEFDGELEMILSAPIG